MINDTIPADLADRPERWMNRPSLALFVVIVIAWTALAWLAVERRVETRTAALVVQGTADARQAVSSIAANVDRVFNRLQGLAAVLGAGSDVKAVLASFGPDAAPSRLPYAERKADWEQRPDLLPLNRVLRSAIDDFGIDIMWVLNAGGDCVAASNAGEAMSFVGTHYGDREYFTAPRAGLRGQQYAVGRVTKVPGLFFSAPVTVDGKFLGAVAVKSDLSRIASALNHPNAFVTDEQGVVIMAANPLLEMRALPGAAVHQIPPERRVTRYMRKDFGTLDTGATGRDGLRRVSGSPYPHVAERSELPQHSVTVHILAPLRQINELRDDAFVTFLLLSSLGALLVALGFGGWAYASRRRQYRRSLEEKNEMLNGLNAHLRELSTVDPLTGLYNRRHLADLLGREMLKAARNGKPIAAIMMDIDHFKRFNDTWGHEAGDIVLKRVADVIRETVRVTDIACRYGGEEFIIVLPECTAEQATQQAERLRRDVKQLTLEHDGRPLGSLTVSAGIAAYPVHGSTSEGVIKCADQALYKAKEAGRDRVVAFEPDAYRPAEIRPAA